MSLLDRLEEGRAQSRGQRQGEEGGEEDRDRQCDGELAIDSARRSGEERHRQEHRDQHERDSDDRAADLAHRLARRLHRRQAFLAHDPLDILDHHDRVVDQDADRQHHAEQRQNVDRKAEQPQTQTRTSKGDRHDQRRDQRRAPVLQEQEHDEEDEEHRLDQRLDHFLDRGFDKGRGVVGDRPGDIARQARRDLFQSLLHALRCGKRVGTGGQLDRHARHRLAVERGRAGIGLRADLDPRDLAQPHHCRAVAGAQDDVLELFGRGEAAIGGDGGGDLLPVGQRLGADRTARRLSVLLADRGENGRGRELVGGQRVRIEPDAHRIFRSEQLHIAHAVHTAQFVDHLSGGDIAQIIGIVLPPLGGQRDDHQEAGIGLPHGDALSANLFGQTRLDRAQPVLYLGLRNIDVGPGLEGHGDGRGAVRDARRGHVEEAVDPVELLLDHLSDVFFQSLGIGAGIDHADRQRRRRDFGILLDRERAQREEACQQDTERDDPCEDGPVDEEA